MLQRVPPSRYALTHGQCLSVGVGGFLAKGGGNWFGGERLLGKGSYNVVRHTVVTAAGDIYNVDAEGVHKVDLDTGLELDHSKHTHLNNLSFALGTDGSSYGIMTEFLYKVYERPGRRLFSKRYL